MKGWKNETEAKETEEKEDRYRRKVAVGIVQKVSMTASVGM